MSDNIIAVRVGVISDTHGNLPEDIWAVFDGVEMIIHAGDIGDRWVLNQLETIAPVYAVRGNTDSGSFAFDLPESRGVTVAGVEMFVVHDVLRMKIDPAGLGIGVVIHGHEHRRQVIQNGPVLYLNPGAVANPRGGESASVAVLSIADGRPTVEFFTL